MTRNVTLLILLIFLAAVDPVEVSSQEPWKPVSNDNGVAIYSHRVAGHEESEFKGSIDINQSIEVVGAVLADIPAYTRWFFKCLQARKIPQISSSAYNFMVYIALDTPWPLWSRDIVYDVKINISRASGKVEVDCRTIPEPIVPTQTDHVRITDSELKWMLEKINSHQTRVSFILRTDAGGSVGTYWSNLGSWKTIYHSLINLQSISADPKYEAFGRELYDKYRTE